MTKRSRDGHLRLDRLKAEEGEHAKGGDTRQSAGTMEKIKTNVTQPHIFLSFLPLTRRIFLSLPQRPEGDTVSGDRTDLHGHPLPVYHTFTVLPVVDALQLCHLNIVRSAAVSFGDGDASRVHAAPASTEDERRRDDVPRNFHNRFHRFIVLNANNGWGA